MVALAAIKTRGRKLIKADADQARDGPWTAKDPRDRPDEGPRANQPPSKAISPHGPPPMAPGRQSVSSGLDKTRRGLGAVSRFGLAAHFQGSTSVHRRGAEAVPDLSDGGFGRGPLGRLMVHEIAAVCLRRGRKVR